MKNVSKQLEFDFGDKPKYKSNLGKFFSNKLSFTKEAIQQLTREQIINIYKSCVGEMVPILIEKVEAGLNQTMKYLKEEEHIAYYMVTVSHDYRENTAGIEIKITMPEVNNDMFTISYRVVI